MDVLLAFEDFGGALGEDGFALDFGEAEDVLAVGGGDEAAFEGVEGSVVVGVRGGRSVC